MLIYLKFLKIPLFTGILITSALACENSVSSSDMSATVYVKKSSDGYYLIRNEEPFQVKGAAGNAHFRELKEAGGNTIRLYDTIDLEKKLDAAQEFGLATIVDIPLPKYGDGSYFYEKDLAPAKRKIRNLVSKVKDHPALLYWNVGNELYYPTFYQSTEFFDSFNSLVELVQETDPNHPVSTAIIGGNRRRLASVVLKSPGLDLLSINSFGNLTDLKERMEPLELLWEGPYVITEWGVNGPWEEAETSWGAPIEQNSTEKARIIEDRYKSPAIQDPNCLGSIAFFWGNKQERTHTWFSFSKEGYKSESYYKLKALWNNDSTQYNGTTIGGILINDLYANQDVILPTGEKANAEVLIKEPGKSSIDFSWEIRKEAWADVEEEQPVEKGLILGDPGNILVFRTPDAEGPYRLFVNITDSDGNFSTANIPFYVLNPANGE